MKPAIYHVEFESSTGGRGEGLVVLKDGTVNGGDPGYTYVGRFERHGSGITGTLSAKQWTRSHKSVFGDLPGFHLAFVGAFSGNDASFEVEGQMPVSNAPSILIRGKRLEFAA